MLVMRLVLKRSLIFVSRVGIPAPPLTLTGFLPFSRLASILGAYVKVMHVVSIDGPHSQTGNDKYCFILLLVQGSTQGLGQRAGFRVDE